MTKMKNVAEDINSSFQVEVNLCTVEYRLVYYSDSTCMVQKCNKLVATPAVIARRRSKEIKGVYYSV